MGKQNGTGKAPKSEAGTWLLVDKDDDPAESLTPGAYEFLKQTLGKTEADQLKGLSSDLAESNKAPARQKAH